VPTFSFAKPKSFSPILPATLSPIISSGCLKSVRVVNLYSEEFCNNRTGEETDRKRKYSDRKRLLASASNYLVVDKKAGVLNSKVGSALGEAGSLMKNAAEFTSLNRRKHMHALSANTFSGGAFLEPLLTSHSGQGRSGARYDYHLYSRPSGYGETHWSNLLGDLTESEHWPSPSEDFVDRDPRPSYLQFGEF